MANLLRRIRVEVPITGGKASAERPIEESFRFLLERESNTSILRSFPQLAVVSPDSFETPTIITRAGPSTRKKFFEFFFRPDPQRQHQHASRLLPAIQQFLAWAERAGYQDLEDIEPITVAAYIEILQRRAAPPTVKQHMAAIRMLFSWLTEKGVLAMNPAREVKTERFSRAEGKTPATVFASF
jgi:hypothetical protein